MDPSNVFEYELLAKERMNPVSWDFYAGGSDDEVTLRANQADFTRIRLRPRMLVDVSRIDTSMTLLGERVAMPVGVAPTAQHRLAHPDGEVGVARATAAAGVIQVLSMASAFTMEDVAASAPGPPARRAACSASAFPRRPRSRTSPTPARRTCWRPASTAR